MRIWVYFCALKQWEHDLVKQSEKWKRGLPYVGNKGQKAEKIIDIFPSGHRLVDVFSGGGSISLTAASSGKWDEVIYNDRRKTVVELLHTLITDKPHVDLMKYVLITREQFFDWRDNQPDSIERTLVLLCWSFGNNMSAYLWGKNIESDKQLMTRALFYGDTSTELDTVYPLAKTENTIFGKYAVYHRWRRDRCQRLEQLQRLQRLQQLLQLQQLEQLQRLKRHELLEPIKYSSVDYRLLDIKPNDIVYCDPPYIGTSTDYGGFDNDSFQRWLAKCPAKQIYISEYTQLPHTEVALNLGKKQSLTATGKRRDELLLKYVK